MAPGSAHFRVVASSICLPLPPRAGRTPRPVDKLSGFFTEKKGSWGVNFRDCVHSPPGPPPLQNPHPAPRPACPCSLSWIYCEFEKERHVYSYLEQLPDTWVMGEGTGVTLGPARIGGEAPSQPTQEPLSLRPPLRCLHLCPGTAGLEPSHHRPHAFAIRQFQKHLQTCKASRMGVPQEDMGSPKAVQGRMAQKRGGRKEAFAKA